MNRWNRSSNHTHRRHLSKSPTRIPPSIHPSTSRSILARRRTLRGASQRRESEDAKRVRRLRELYFSRPPQRRLQRNAPPMPMASANVQGEAVIKGKSSHPFMPSYVPMLLLLV